MVENNFKILEVLGEGTYGIVYKALSLKNNSEVALKVIKKKKEEEGFPPSAIREISLLKDLEHLNIIRLIEVNHHDKLTMVLEYASTDLGKLMEKEVLETGKVKKFLYQIIKGIDHIHKHKILHRDIKPGNLLITDKGIIKIADFGLARDCGIPVSNISNEVVSLWYRAPDVILGNTDYQMNIDVWAIGCIFAEMILGKVLFRGEEEFDQLNRIFKVFGTPTIKFNSELTKLPNYSKFLNDYPKYYTPIDLKSILPEKTDEAAIDLMKTMLALDPINRISTEEALLHPYFKDIQEEMKNLYSKQ